MTWTRISFLGGLGEFGMNTALIETERDLFALDCGLAFPDSHMHGVDVVLPDFSYIEEKKDKYRGIVLTHGHQDHLGATPYLVERCGGPIWGSAFTLGLLKPMMADKGVTKKPKFHLLEDGKSVQVGENSITPLFVTHSIFDAMSICVDSPGGRLLFSGDFKIDQSPLDGKKSNLGLLGQMGQEGVDLLLMDSTNVTRDGFSESERSLMPSFERLLHNQTGRLFFAMFSTNMLRLKGLLELCAKQKKKVALLGRSLINAYQVARNLGYLPGADKVLVPIEKIRGFAPKQVVIVTTGTQGEPRGSLNRLAHNEVRQVQVEPGDTVVFSARIIPGNERVIYRLMDQFYRLGAQVLSAPRHHVHVSGHAYREELKMYLSLAQPKNFVPLHGNYRNLMLQRDLAVEMGIAEENTLLVENGAIIKIEDGTVEQDGYFTPERIYLDGDSDEPLDDLVLRDRQHMAEDGFVVPVILMDEARGSLETAPEMLCRGLMGSENQTDLCEHALERLQDVLSALPPDEARDPGLVEDIAIRTLRRFFRKKLQKRPLILPKVLEL